ncbi:MAG: pseudouridine synthase [Gallintestinimicrobium sp.]
MILYEDKDIIVCHKMAGIAVSARIQEKDLVSMLNNHLMEQADQRMEPVRVVHRLDQPVEGIVVFTKNKGGCVAVGADLNGSMKKVYRQCAV